MKRKTSKGILHLIKNKEMMPYTSNSESGITLKDIKALINEIPKVNHLNKKNELSYIK